MDWFTSMIGNKEVKNKITAIVCNPSHTGLSEADVVRVLYCRYFEGLVNSDLGTSLG